MEWRSLESIGGWEDDGAGVGAVGAGGASGAAGAGCEVEVVGAVLEITGGGCGGPTGG